MNNSFTMHFLMKMLNKRVNSFFLQWDFFRNGGSTILAATIYVPELNDNYLLILFTITTIIFITTYYFIM